MAAPPNAAITAAIPTAAHDCLLDQPFAGGGAPQTGSSGLSSAVVGVSELIL
jgi:hypothetical protein